MKQESIGFFLLAIKTEQFATFEEDYAPKKHVDLFTSLEFKLNPEEQQIGVYAMFTFNQGKKSFIRIQVSCHFAIEPNAWLSFQKDHKITFPKEFLGHLVMISVGTTRGILHTKTEGTIFNQYILPTINVNQLIDKDASFDLEDQ